MPPVLEKKKTEYERLEYSPLGVLVKILHLVRILFRLVC